MAAAKFLPHNLSIPEHKFVKEVVKDGNVQRALQIGYPNQQPINLLKNTTKILARPRVREAVLAELDRIGLTENYIAANIRELVESGKGKGEFKGANAATSKGALELAIKMRERYDLKRSTSYNYNIVQELGNSDNKKIYTKRQETVQFFNDIETNEELQSNIIGHNEQAPNTPTE